jgi:acyl carrier protein
MKNVESRIQKIVSDQFDSLEQNVTTTTKFDDDLGMDSLDAVELVMALEDEFELEIPDEAAEKFITVQDVIDYITNNAK